MAATKKSWDHFGLPVYDVDGEEYAVGTDKQADKAAARAIEDSLWAFKADFLATFLNRHNQHLRDLSDSAYEAFKASLAKMQSDLSEDAGPIIRALIGNHLSDLVREAIQFDGRGHFLSPYDGEERDTADVPGLPKGKFAYRVN